MLTVHLGLMPFSRSRSRDEAAEDKHSRCGLIDPVSAVRRLAVRKHVRHVGVQTKEKSANGHEPFILT